MAAAAFRIPSTVQYGVGALDELGPTTRELGVRHALLVTDEGMVRLGVAEQARQQLEAAGTRVTLFDGVEPDPTLKNVAAGLTLLRQGRPTPDGIVAVGGGSSIDCAKATKALLSASWSGARDGRRRNSAVESIERKSGVSSVRPGAALSCSAGLACSGCS